MINQISLNSHRYGSAAIKLIPASELSEVVLKTGAKQVEMCMDFLDIAKSPNQFVTIANKQSYGHPEKPEILWGLYRKTGMQDVKEYSKLTRGITPSGGWSTFGWGSKKHINHQIKLFERAFSQKPDIGEFIAYADNFRTNNQGNMVFRYYKNKQLTESSSNFRLLLNKGLAELKRHQESYTPMTQAYFLRPIEMMFAKSDSEFTKLTIKTMLNTANADVKTTLKNYKKNGEIELINGAIDDIGGFRTRLNARIKTGGFKNEPEVIAFEKDLAKRISGYRKLTKIDEKKLTKNEKKEVERFKYNLAEGITKLIDKNFKEFTFDNFYNVAKSKKLTD